MRREFIGGRVPKMVKDAFVKEAEAAGLTLTEHLEKVLLQRMNEGQEEPAPNISEFDLRKLIKEELLVHLNSEDQLLETNPLENDQFERVGEVPHSETDFHGSDLEEDPVDDFPYPVIELLNQAVYEIWDRSNQNFEADDLSQSNVSGFLEDLAVELQSVTEDLEVDEYIDAYGEYLPESITEELDEALHRVIQLDVEELEPKVIIYLIADDLNQRADQLFQEERIIEVSFDRRDYWFFDNLLEKENASRNKEKQFPDLKGLILFLLGNRLIENGTGFWGITNEGMVELGKRLRKISTTKLCES